MAAGQPENTVKGCLEAMIAHDRAKEAAFDSNAGMQKAIQASADTETARQDHAEACRYQLDLTYIVREMLAVKPIMARYNTFTLLMLA